MTGGVSGAVPEMATAKDRVGHGAAHEENRISPSRGSSSVISDSTGVEMSLWKRARQIA